MAAAQRVTRSSSQSDPSTMDPKPICNHVECGREINTDLNDTFITCDVCSKPFHLVCSGVSKATYLDWKKPVKQVGFFCVGCSPLAKSLLGGMASLHKKCDDLDQRVTTLENSPRGAGDFPAVDTIVVSAVDKSCIEMENRQGRKRNVILFGVPEPSTPGLADGDKHAADKRKLDDILATVDSASAVISNSFRFGKSAPGKIRPIKVVFSASYMAEMVLAKAGRLKGTAHQGAYIKPDFTPMQEAEQKVLITELKRQRDAGKDVVIRRGRVAERTPLHQPPPNGTPSAPPSHVGEDLPLGQHSPPQQQPTNGHPNGPPTHLRNGLPQGGRRGGH